MSVCESTLTPGNFTLKGKWPPGRAVARAVLKDQQNRLFEWAATFRSLHDHP